MPQTLPRPALSPGLPWVWGGYGDCDESPWACGDSRVYGYGAGMGTVMNPHGPVGILWRFSNGCEIKRKRVKHAIDVVVAGWISPNTVQFVSFLLAFFSSLSILNIHRPNSYILNYNFHTSRSTLHALQTVYTTNSKNMHLRKTHRVWSLGMKDFVVLWVWRFLGDSHGFFCWYRMGMGIEIQSPRQPCLSRHPIVLCTNRPFDIERG